MEYYRIKYFKEKANIKRCIELISKLRKGLDKEIPKRTLNKKLIFGTWNIREFDSNAKGFGPRKEDDFFYIAEIISRFDIIALQEINDDLRPLKRVLNILGDDYEFIVTDVAAWKSGGNNERLGFIYDKRTVKFNGIAGELVLPQDMLIRNNNGVVERQFARTPFKCSFVSGWFKFKVTTVHIYYGADSESSKKFKRRIDEIDKVAELISDSAKNEKNNVSEVSWKNPYNYFIVGDFNIVDVNNVTYDALAKHGFKTVKNIKGSNRDRTKFYDQISYYKASDLNFDWNDSNEESSRDQNNTDRTFNFFKYIYTKSQYRFYQNDIKKYVKLNKSIFLKEIKTLEKAINDIDIETKNSSIKESRKKTLLSRKKKKLDKIKFNNNVLKLRKAELLEFYQKSDWRTFQVSDHLPLWVEIDTDKSGEYLKSI